jgi:hypothetical protein
VAVAVVAVVPAVEVAMSGALEGEGDRAKVRLDLWGICISRRALRCMSAFCCPPRLTCWFTKHVISPMMRASTPAMMPMMTLGAAPFEPEFELDGGRYVDDGLMVPDEPRIDEYRCDEAGDIRRVVVRV